MIGRRAFIAGVVSAFVSRPLFAQAQQAQRVYRIGFLWDGPAMFADAMDAFRQSLRDFGWIEGRNIVIEHRWTDGKFDRLDELAAELVRLKVDVIVTPSSIYTGAAKRATSTIPIVFMSHADPIGSGHVASLGRPGGNVTGLALMMTETNAKLLELFKEAFPGRSRIAVIWDPATPSHVPGLEAVKAAGPPLGLQLQLVGMRSTKEFDSAFATIVRQRAGGILVLSTPMFIAEANRFAELALKHKLPSMFGPRAHAEAGGLLSYGPDRADLWRRGAIFVDKILKGAKPSDLPVEQPVKFELVVNMKTAKALGITIPQSILVRANRVIE
jgi:putative ABC transport system substrate-binding protein